MVEKRHVLLEHMFGTFDQYQIKWGVLWLLAAALAARLAGANWKEIAARIKTLPGVEFRQQVVFQNKRLTIVNDTTATSGEGGIAAVTRFASPSTIPRPF